jgi:uncharacterized delta-60 repeat protein
MSLVPFGFWAASGGQLSYWLATLGGASNDEGYSVATDSADNSYSFGYTESAGAGSSDLFIAKRDAAGEILWQRTLGGGGPQRAYGVAIDSSGNALVLGWTTSEAVFNIDFLLAKYNSSGTLQWQRTLGGSGNDVGYAVAIDSTDNIYVAGDTRPGSKNIALLAKYNSSGTIQWQRTLDATNSSTFSGAAIDSSDNLYVAGNAETGTEYNFLLAKYNSGGTIEWQRTLTGATFYPGFSSVFLDSSDNLYAVGFTDSAGAGSSDLLLAKYNSSGTLQWQRVLGGTSADDGYGVSVDSSGDVYVSGSSSSDGEGSSDLLIAKYNSSGTIQWQRVLGSTGADNGLSIAVDSLDSIYAFGKTTSTGAGGRDFLLAKLKNDGSLTGTYELDGVNFVYAASTLTAATSTLTAATSTLTAATSTLTSATSTLTDASASLTSHIVEL